MKAVLTASRALLFALATVLVLACSQQGSPGKSVGLVTALDSDFDDNSLNVRFTDSHGHHSDQWDMENCCDYSISPVRSPAKPGYSVRFEQRCEDPPVFNGRRAEIKMHMGSLLDRTQNYSFQIYLPPDWHAGDSLNPVIVVQWHDLPDFDLGEDWRTAPLALQLKEGRWEIAVDYDDQPKSTAAVIKRNASGYLLTPYRPDVGRWTAWRFRVHWKPDNSGNLEVWKDGKQVVNAIGPIGYNDRDGPYFKAGVYRGASLECPIVFLMDDFHFRDETP